MIFRVHLSKFSISTLIIYTCIYLPLVQTKRTFLTIIGFILYMNRHPSNCSDGSAQVSGETQSCSVDLPMKRFGDLKCSSSACCDSNDDEAEACSVCLVEFESEDFVSQLSRCGHVFHISCIDRWLEKNQFTCPLCRSVLLNVVEGCNHAT